MDKVPLYALFFACELWFLSLAGTPHGDQPGDALMYTGRVVRFSRCQASREGCIGFSSMREPADRVAWWIHEREQA